MGELEVGDEVWLRETRTAGGPTPWSAWAARRQRDRRPTTPDGRVSITYPNLPYVARYDHGGDFSWNSNNYVHGETACIKPRGKTA